jgi:LmbE family N-acetylglucosaminyl deacetylase
MLFWAAEEINYRSDISETFHLKIAALRCHESQVQGFPDPANLEDWVKQRCKDMAEEEPFELAEGFHRVEINW